MNSVPNPLTTLTTLAVDTFSASEREKESAVDSIPFGFHSADPVLDEQMRLSLVNFFGHGQSNELADAIFRSSDLNELRTASGETAPMVITPGGAIRTDAGGLVRALFTSARQQMFFLRLPHDEGTFVRLVLSNFDELRRAARGEKVRSYYLIGFSGVAPAADVALETPWGNARRAPDVTPRFIAGLWTRQTNMVLAIPELSEVKFDRAAQPPAVPIDAGTQRVRDRALQLFPLSLALAAGGNTGIAPVPTWMTSLSPFVAGFSWSAPFATAPPVAVLELGAEQVRAANDWSRVVEQRHLASIDVASRRIVSAISHRLDPTDKLIDAVMVWENLVGTRFETSFRVTAALAKLLERTPSRRGDLRRELTSIYDTRSRVVHGDAIADDEVRAAANRAVEIGVEALRMLYRDRAELLDMQSTARADRLVLEEP